MCFQDPAAVALRNKKKRPPAVPAQVQLDIKNKHPVSLLGELSGKRKWGPPSYELVDEDGPAHKKSFIFKVHSSWNSQLFLYKI